MTPSQAVDNPHDIIANRNEWVQFEYERQRGSLPGLADYAKRFAMMRAIQIELAYKHGSPAVLKAMAYLLEMEQEIQ